MTTPTDVQTIQLSSLNIVQLGQLKTQLDQELEVMGNSLQQLKIAQRRFVDSGEAVSKITTDSVDKEIFIPLSSSMYVPGSIADTTMLIDIGTGYYAEKDVKGSTEYFKRKVKYVNDHLEKVQSIVAEKMKIRDLITETMELKVHQQMQANKPPASK